MPVSPTPIPATPAPVTPTPIPPTPIPDSPTPPPPPTETPPPAPADVRTEPSCCQFDAPGDDNQNKAQEWVCFKNHGGGPANMGNWQVRDEHGWTYTFPAFTLQPGAIVRIHTGCGGDSAEDLFWCKGGGAAVWNNGGDTVFLFDAAGNLVNQYSY